MPGLCGNVPSFLRILSATGMPVPSYRLQVAGCKRDEFGPGPLFCVHFPPRGLLLLRMNLNEAKARHAQLVQEMRQHDHAYYVLAQPSISDRGYDRLYHELLDLEKQFPQLVTPDSPTQRVSGQPLKEFKQVQHLQPMLSLDNTYSQEDVRASV